MECSIKFSTTTYPEGVEFDVVSLSGSTDEIIFFPVMTAEYIDVDAFTTLINGVEQMWNKYGLDKVYALVPKKREYDDNV